MNKRRPEVGNLKGAHLPYFSHRGEFFQILINKCGGVLSICELPWVKSSETFSIKQNSLTSSIEKENWCNNLSFFESDVAFVVFFTI